MNLPSRLARPLALAAVLAGFAASAGTAAADPSAQGLSHRSDNAPGGATSAVDDHRPAGAGQGRKVG